MHQRLIIPGVGPALDMALFSARLLSGIVKWRHVALMVNAFTLDLYLVAADKEANREVGGLIGFNWGISVAGCF